MLKANGRETMTKIEADEIVRAARQSDKKNCEEIWNRPGIFNNGPCRAMIPDVMRKIRDPAYYAVKNLQYQTYRADGPVPLSKEARAKIKADFPSNAEAIIKRFGTRDPGIANLLDFEAK